MRTFAPKTVPMDLAHASIRRSSAQEAAKGATIQPVSRFARQSAEHQANPPITGQAFSGHDFARIPVFPPSPTRVQAKLTVGNPADTYEVEADRVAAQIMRMPGPEPKHACECGGQCPTCQKDRLLQSKRNHAGGIPGFEAPPSVYKVLAGPGRPLDHADRSFMEARFGHDFKHVRVHADNDAAEAARRISARAYTAGRDIVFGAGEHAAGSASRRQL